MTFKWDIPSRPKLIMPANWHPVEVFPELHGVVAVDTETYDPGLSAGKGSSWATDDGMVCGISLAWREYGASKPYTASMYVGINHAAGNSDPDKAIAWLKAQLSKPDVYPVFANAIYDLGWLKKRYDIEPYNLPIDVQGMAALLDERRHSYSLDSLVFTYFKRRKSVDKLRTEARALGYLDPYKVMHKLPTWAVEVYATDDAVDTLDLYYEMLPLLEQQDLMRVLELEKECLLIGRDLRLRGVRVDVKRAAVVKKEFLEKKEAALIRVKDLTGVAVDPDDKNSIVAALLAENPSLQFNKTKTGQNQVNAAFIDSLHSPVGAAIREAKKLTKAVQTFMDGHIFGHVSPDGRIHADFNPLRRNSDDDAALYGVAGGRWSCSNPNLQNVSRRDPYIGPMVRSCFLPEEGEVWGKLDYSSQEPRLATHFAYELWKMREGLGDYWKDRFQGVDDMVRRYNENPELSMHKVVAATLGIDIKKDERQYDNVKILNLGIIYGMGGKKFAQQIGLPTKFITTEYGRTLEVAGDEAQQLIDRHGAAFPWIKDAADYSALVAASRGYMRTITGRRIRFEERDSRGRVMYTHKGFNASVQGSAADQMKIAQCGFRRAGIPILLVVHDDANLSIPRGDAGRSRMKDAAEIMAEAVKLNVPSMAEGRAGRNWGTVGMKHKGLI